MTFFQVFSLFQGLDVARFTLFNNIWIRSILARDKSSITSLKLDQKGGLWRTAFFFSIFIHNWWALDILLYYSLWNITPNRAECRRKKTTFQLQKFNFLIIFLWSELHGRGGKTRQMVALQVDPFSTYNYNVYSLGVRVLKILLLTGSSLGNSSDFMIRLTSEIRSCSLSSCAVKCEEMKRNEVPNK